MATTGFWKYFNVEISPQLGLRQSSFKSMFEYLDSLNRPVFIVETGCVRNAGTYQQEGQSTLLFDKYAAAVPGSIVYTVDIDPNAAALCKTLVTPLVKVHAGESIGFLRNVADHPPATFTSVDLLYLDSGDVDFSNPHPAALRHLKELLAIAPAVTDATLVVLNDSPGNAVVLFNESGTVSFLSKPDITGRGKYIAEYAEAIHARVHFSGYQCGWLGLSSGREPAETIKTFSGLVFDVGANVGDKTEMFLSQGASRVVAVEPQPMLGPGLVKRFGGDQRVTVVRKALSNKPQRLMMSICSEESTISTFSDEWKKGRFAEHTWDQQVEIEATTLDLLIDEYGLPDFCKIDVEGFEYQVLQGLSKPIPALSFEFTKEFLGNAHQCVEHLAGIGGYEFNYILGAAPEFASKTWLTDKQLFDILDNFNHPLLWGDIHARRVT